MNIAPIVLLASVLALGQGFPASFRAQQHQEVREIAAAEQDDCPVIKNRSTFGFRDAVNLIINAIGKSLGGRSSTCDIPLSDILDAMAAFMDKMNECFGNNSEEGKVRSKEFRTWAKLSRLFIPNNLECKNRNPDVGNRQGAATALIQALTLQ